MKLAILLLASWSMKYASSSTGYATYYGGNLNGNACGMSGTASAYSNKWFAAIGSSNFDDGYGCGKCYKIKCTGPYGHNPGCSCGDSPTITVQAIDQCPECSASHFDLNQAAFAAIVAPGKAGTCGKISVTYDRVDCTSISGNFYVVNKGGTSKYWYGFHLNDVNDDGGINKVELYKSGSKVGYCNKNQGPSFWICTASQGSFPNPPLSIKITSDKGKSVTASNCITSYTGGKKMTCNKNLGGGGSSPNPSPTTRPGTTSSGGSSGQKLKISNKKGLNQWWYAVTLSQTPSAGIKWVKMKGKGMSKWETGVKEYDYYKFTKNKPYKPPFSFKVRSNSGQTITSNNVISNLNEGTSGYMSKAFSASYTEEDTDTSTLPVAGIVAIILLTCVIIAVAGYCYIKRRKQKAEVSFKDSDATAGDTPVDGDGDATTKTGGYDMSPIDVTSGDTPAGNEKENEEENEEEIEVDVEVEQKPTPAGDE